MKFDEIAALTIHDVKNRLALMASHAESQGDNDTLRGALEAAATLTHLLLFYKAERGSLGIDLNARVPADLLEELVAGVSTQAGITITADTSNAPTLWYYDEHLIRLVLTDAVYNALRHAKTSVHLSATEANNQLHFVVSDDGPGYPEAMLGKPIAMQEMTREGTGLGLHLANHIAALHKTAVQEGRIELSNHNGAIFSLHLPQ